MRWRMASKTAKALWPSLRCRTPGVMPMRLERAEAADAEQQFLANAGAGVAAVEARGELAVFGALPATLESRRKRSQRPDLDLPDLGADAAAAGVRFRR